MCPPCEELGILLYSKTHTATTEVVMSTSLFRPFDARTVIDQLKKTGVAAISIMPEMLIRALITEAQYQLRYEPQPERVGVVRQQLGLCQNFPTGSVVPPFAHALARHLTYMFEGASAPALNGPLVFNNISMLNYPSGAFGITPHIDLGSPRNVIVLVSLTGSAELRVRKNRKGEITQKVMMTPGSTTLIRGLGFAGMQEPVMHEAVIRAWPRYSLGLRQLPETQPTSAS